MIQNGAADNTIGGTTAAARDVISGNDWDGVHIGGSGTTGNVVEGDYIGVNVYRHRGPGQRESGVGIYAGASNNTIGGTVAGSGDVISGNGSTACISPTRATTGNVVEGTTSAPTRPARTPWPTCDGVVIQNGAANNTIGGTHRRARDVISGNDEDGVHIVDGGTRGNVVEGDFIGIDRQRHCGPGQRPAAWLSTPARATTPSAGPRPAPVT